MSQGRSRFIQLFCDDSSWNRKAVHTEFLAALTNHRMIFQVNDADISPMSHEEAVMFLRQCGDRVKLRLYRDASQTPVSALSPTDEAKTFKPKPLLR